ncbi:hypothetical protein [Spiroplasma endosymbiont of Labia minor]|uniref:hypothetical protein n=1 Tax=Spiroplasma endosymbiont of Labia minor TaxID=3066305 RepID=UPI0030CA8D6E
MEELIEIARSNQYQIPNDIVKYDTVYIFTDDTYKMAFVDKKKGNYKHIIRNFTFCLGKINQKDSRGSKLIHKRVKHLIYECKSDKNYNLINKSIILIYQTVKQMYGEKDWKFVVTGDGASYIKTLASQLNAKIVLDYFHLVKEMRVLFPLWRSNKEHREKLAEFLAAVRKDPEYFILNYLNPAIKHDFIPGKLIQLKYLKNYIKQNIQGILNYKQDWYFGSCTESCIWHFIKSKCVAKTYNIKTLDNILCSEEAWINNINPYEIWLEDIYIDQQEQIYSNNFVPKESDVYQHNIDIPILNSNLKIAGALKELMYNYY